VVTSLLFPFLLQRCGENINKRIHSLHIWIQNTELRDDFRLALETYVPMSGFQAEFHGAEMIIERYGNAVPPFATFLKDLVDNITNETVRKLDAENAQGAYARRAYAYLFILADVLARSRFMKTLVDDRNLVNKERKERVEKLKRRLGKVCQYVSGITHLVQKAKRLFPIPHRWVTDTFPCTGEGEFDLCNNAFVAVSRGLNLPFLSPDILNKLNKSFPLILDNWTRQQSVHAHVHAEIRIILHFGQLSPDDLSVHPIGVSKRSCFCCALWIESHNHIFTTQWMTSRSHGKPYANWALPGAACSYAIEVDGRSSIDKAVLEAVGVRLVYTFDRLFPGQRRILDEHNSSGDENFDDEEMSGGWRLKVNAMALDRFTTREIDVFPLYDI
jgi:hypothetical protein